MAENKEKGKHVITLLGDPLTLDMTSMSNPVHRALLQAYMDDDLLLFQTIYGWDAEGEPTQKDADKQKVKTLRTNPNFLVIFRNEDQTKNRKK